MIHLIGKIKPNTLFEKILAIDATIWDKNIINRNITDNVWSILYDVDFKFVIIRCSK